MDAKGWTESELQILMDGVAKGMSFGEIGAVLGRKAATVGSKWSNLVCIGLVEPRERQELPRVKPYRHASLTAAMLGDPPPHRSALGREVQPHEYASKGGQGRFQSHGDGLWWIGG